MPIQFGGGLRTLDDIQLALELGADRVVLGTVAVENPALVDRGDAALGRRIASSSASTPVTARWPPTAGKQTSTVDAIELGHQMQALGVERVVYTDISRDGMLIGVNVETTSRLGDVTGLQGDRQRRRRRHRRYRGRSRRTNTTTSKA